MCAGFSLTIVPPLSLGADQEEKLTLRAEHAEGTITSVHLDKIRSVADQELLISKLKLLPNKSSATVVLFSSPQAMLDKKFLWLDFLNWLIDNNRLSLVCVDEVHLFAHFGMTFREEFKLSTPALFNKRTKPLQTSAPRHEQVDRRGTANKRQLHLRKTAGILSRPPKPVRRRGRRASSS
jgi:superfamily II DNA helicase RecQ